MVERFEVMNFSANNCKGLLGVALSMFVSSAVQGNGPAANTAVRGRLLQPSIGEMSAKTIMIQSTIFVWIHYLVTYIQ